MVHCLLRERKGVRRHDLCFYAANAARAIQYRDSRFEEFAMTEPVYDLLIRGGRVATASDVFEADVAISGETIPAIGRGLPGARREVDARGKLVLPGGVDSHAHIEQLSAAGIANADTFESATTSAAFGGTTAVISFAAQHVGMQLPPVLEDYHALAKKGAVIDYA